MPRTKTSITPLVGDVAAGDEVRVPPRDCQADHADPIRMTVPERVVGALYKDVEAVSILASTAGPVPEASCPPILDQAGAPHGWQ